MRTKYIFFTIFLFLQLFVKAQVKPVEVTTTVIPPYSVFLSDYIVQGSNKLSANILFTDYNETSWDVRLKITIQSNTVLLKTKDTYRPTEPITLYPGQAFQVRDNDFAEYLDYNNLDISGITIQELGANGKLPEGYYTICIQVIDYDSNKPLSEPSCVSVFLQLGAPPTAIYPLDETVVPPTDNQNILFQWQPASAMSFSPPSDIKYKIELYEILDNVVNPKMAIDNHHVEQIFESDYTTNTQFQYNISNPPLERGKKYAYRIRVEDEQGLGLFKNDGYSEPYWFYYGYPEGGHIDIIQPEENHSFGKRELGLFKWQGADNLVQGEEMYYTLKIVLRDSLDAEIAMETQPAWFERSTTMALIHSSMSLSITKPFIPLEKYAWQVTAHTAEQTIAKSDVHVFTGPPEVEYFFAGGKRIDVTQTTNGDLNHFSGKGTMPFNPEGTLIEEIEFDDIQLQKQSGLYRMISGAIYDEVTCTDEIEIQSIDSANQNAIFRPETLWFSRYDLKIKGVFEYNFPHATDNPNPVKVTSKKKWLNFNSLKIYGDVQTNDLMLNLLSPYGFKFHIYETSQIAIVGNKFSFSLNGEIILPSSVKNDTNTVSIFFDDINNLTYFHNSNTITSDKIDLIPQTGFALRPNIAIIDLDANISPGKFNQTPNWKGIYYESFYLESGNSLDNLGQLSLDNYMQKEFHLTPSDSNKAWVTNQGVTFHLENNLSDEEAKFNQFPSNLTNFLIDITNNTFNHGYLKGKMKIPVISETNEYFFTVPITSSGFNEGFLDVDLENQSFVFNPNGGNQLMNFTIKRAVFAAKERLDLTVDIEWPSINVTMQNVDNLRLWGNYDIGFLVPNGMVNLSQQAVGALSDFQLTVNVIGCGRSDGFYSFGTVADVVMSDDVSGPDGAPQINLYSIAENSLLPEDANYEGQNQPTGENDNSDDFLQLSMDSLNNQIDNLQNLNNDLLSLINADDTEFQNDSTNDYSYYDAEDMIDYPDSTQQYSDIEATTELTTVLNNIEGLIAPEYIQFYNGIKDFSINCNAPQKEKIIIEIKNFAKLYAKSLIDSLMANVTELITDKTDALNNIVISKTDSIKGSANTFINIQIGNRIDALETKLIELSQNDYFDASSIVSEVMQTAKVNLINEITQSINNSIDNNIVYPFTSYVNEHIRDNIERHIVDEVTRNLYSFIDSGINGINIDVPQMLTSVGEEMIHNIHLDKAGETALSLVEDAINGIDINNVYNNIKTDLMSKISHSIDMYTNVIEEQANDIAEQMLGNGVGDLADNVSIDFTDIGSKVQEGDLSDIITIDPTNIAVQTSIVDFVGTITYTEDDPVYGDIWLGDIDFNVKVPDPNKPFAIRGIYMNGKVDGYSYWFCQIEPGGEQSGLGGAITTDAKELTTPLALGPVKLMGVSGRLYNHMHAEGEHGEIILPDNSINYGASLSLVLFDAAQNGKTVRIAARAGVEVAVTGDYIVDFEGNLQLKNKIPKVNEIDQTAMIRGEVAFNYNSAEEHFVGSASVDSEGPQICLHAWMEMDIKPDVWRIQVGSYEDKIVIVPGCAGYSPTGWIIVDQSQVDLGLGLRYSFRAASPWYGVSVYNLSFFAEFYVAAGISAVIAYNPEIKIMEAGLWAEAYAGVGADWTKGNKSGRWTLSESFIAGYAKMTFDPPPTTMDGNLSGYISVLCIEKSFSMSFHKAL